MSENSKEKFEPKYIPNATTITNKSLETFPNVQHFFKNLVKNTIIETKHVGRSFHYHDDIVKHRYYTAHGNFMDYFIRKYLSNQFNVEITDARTEYILQNPDDYIIGTNKKLHDSIREHYEIFKDSKTMAMDIIKSIKIVSLSHKIFFHDPIPKTEYTVKEDNLREIIQFLKKLPYKSVDLNPTLSCQYFNADADLIFDNEVIYEIKTSKQKKVSLRKFYQPIIYGFGFYKKTGIKVKQFKIYNPLLGYEFSIELNNIDFELFEKVLRHDVGLYSRLEELLTEEMVLDLSLFSTKEDSK